MDGGLIDLKLNWKEPIRLTSKQHQLFWNPSSIVEGTVVGVLDCPQLHPGTSHWQFKIDHDRNVYTMENGKSYKSSFFCWFVYFPKCCLLNIYQHTTVADPKKRGRHGRSWQPHGNISPSEGIAENIGEGA